MRRTKHRKAPRPREIDGALIVVQPGPRVVERVALAVEDAKRLALAKRAIEAALRRSGMTVRQAGATISGMSHAEIFAEAERLSAAAAVPVEVAVQVAAPSTPGQATSAPWWHRMLGRSA